MSDRPLEILAHLLETARPMDCIEVTPGEMATIQRHLHQSSIKCGIHTHPGEDPGTLGTLPLPGMN